VGIRLQPQHLCIVRAASPQAWVEGKSQSAGEAVRISVQLSLGGAAWGLAVGIAATLWLRFMFENIHAEITLTVS
jgi:NhaP-type Na+/H+ or K+/H+ antiporter